MSDTLKTIQWRNIGVCRLRQNIYRVIAPVVHGISCKWINHREPVINALGAFRWRDRFREILCG